jgi:hypothetical protein
VVRETATIVVLTPANFYHFRRPKYNFQPLSLTFETFGKKLGETKIVAWVNGRKSKQKNRKKKAFKSPAMKRQQFFYQNLPIMAEVSGFLAAAEVLLKCYE